jgi:hypothetical protein
VPTYLYSLLLITYLPQTYPKKPFPAKKDSHAKPLKRFLFNLDSHSPRFKSWAMKQQCTINGFNHLPNAPYPHP